MTINNTLCHFCALETGRIICSTESCLVIRDLYPVTPLHTLIISKRHVSSYFDLTYQERLDTEHLLNSQRLDIQSTDSSVTGFNIGINCGQDAGQTVMHFHMHLIPRRKGDIEDPRGGVRGVIPNKRIY